MLSVDLMRKIKTGHPLVCYRGKVDLVLLIFYVLVFGFARTNWHSLTISNRAQHYQWKTRQRFLEPKVDQKNPTETRRRLIPVRNQKS